MKYFFLCENVISAVVGHLNDVSFFGRGLLVAALCENFAHLRSLVFTFISHSCSYYVGSKCLSLRSAHFMPRIVCFRDIELAQFTFLGLRN